MDTTPEKAYFAFISYQRKDEEWADRLRNKLEHYRLPSNVRKKDASLPKEIRPIFRDALELAGGVLAKEIETALQNSKFLIVICSPNSAKSPWVNKEVQTFIDFGREDHIIPFIIDGTPFSDNEETECFPPAIRSLKGEKELLGININELSRDAASIKVVARMFGLKFDALWQRYERELRRKRWMWIGGALLFALVSLGIGGYIAHQNKELEARNKEVVAERDRANTERDRANSERERAESANASLLLANDSIKRQYTLIEQQKNEIKTERDNVKSANYAMQVNLSRILAEKAIGLTDEGDAYLARLLSLQALPPNMPYTIEAEKALRYANKYQSSILRGHTKTVSSLCVSPNGDYVLSASADSTIRIWDINTGKCVEMLKGLWAVAMSPDGKYFASLSNDNSFCVWEFSTSQYVYRDAIDNEDIFETILFSPDNTLVTASSLGFIDFWNVTKKKHVRRVKDHEGTVYSVAFSPDGKLFASASEDAKIRLWNTTDGTCLDTLKGHQDKVLSVNFNNNGNYLVSASKDGRCIVWRIAQGKGKYLKTIEERQEIVRYACFSPNNNFIITASNDNNLRLYSTTKWSQVNTLKGHQGGVYSAAFTPRGIVSSSSDGTIRLWDFPSSEKIVTDDIGKIHSSAFSPDGKKMIVLLNRHYFEVKNVDSGKSQSFRGHDYLVNMAEFSTDGNKIISASEDKTVIVWDATSSKIMGRLKHLSAVKSAHFINGDTEIITATEDGMITCWNVKTGIQLYAFKVQEELVNDAYLHEKSGEVFCITKNKILIIEPKSGRRISQLTGHTGIINSVDFRPDVGLLLTASDDTTLRLWDIVSGRCLNIFTGHSDRVLSATISPDGHYMVSISYDKKMYIWDIHTATHLLSYDVSTFGTACFSVDGENILLCSEKGISDRVEFLSLKKLMKLTEKRFMTRPLTIDEKKTYYLE